LVGGGTAVDTHALLAATLVDLPLEWKITEGSYLEDLLVLKEADVATLATTTTLADERVHNEVGVLATAQRIDDLLPGETPLVYEALPLRSVREVDLLVRLADVEIIAAANAESLDLGNADPTGADDVAENLAILS
jgi:hypothetical protein